jgi:hypothetical protein
MNDDLIVIDNVLTDPYQLIALAKKIHYHSNEANLLPDMVENTESKLWGGWRGYRSNPLDTIDADLEKLWFDEIFNKAFSTQSVTGYDIVSYLHFSTARLNNIIPQHIRWHNDIDPSKNYYPKYAGVVYLTPNAPLDSGTSVILSDKKIKNVENVFNRAVIYKADLMHKPNRLFGDTMDNSRLTLTFFIKDISLVNKV